MIIPAPHIELLAECPKCKKRRTVSVTIPEAQAGSWAQFPQPLSDLKSGILSMFCGGACYDAHRSTSGPHFNISTRRRT